MGDSLPFVGLQAPPQIPPGALLPQPPPPPPLADGLLSTAPHMQPMLNTSATDSSHASDCMMKSTKGRRRRRAGLKNRNSKQAVRMGLIRSEIEEVEKLMSMLGEDGDDDHHDYDYDHEDDEEEEQEEEDEEQAEDELMEFDEEGEEFSQELASTRAEEQTRGCDRASEQAALEPMLDSSHVEESDKVCDTKTA